MRILNRLRVPAVLFFLSLFLLTGCSEKDRTENNIIEHKYTFSGENELWTADLKEEGKEYHTEDEYGLHYSSECSEVCTITYKNDVSELSDAKKLKISYENSTGGGSLSTERVTRKTYTIQSSGRTHSTQSFSANSDFIKQDETILVMVELDGDIQTFELVCE